MNKLGIIAGMVALGGLLAAGAQARPNWLLTFTKTKTGSHIVGNINAPKKITEYVSYTCGTCANFEANSAPKIKSQLVANGKASFEIRNFVRDPIDLTIAMLARCRGKGRFFGNHKYLLANQNAILNRTGRLSETTKQKLKTGDLQGFIINAYGEMGLSEFAAKRAISDAQAKKCMADTGAMNVILDMTENAGTQYGINSTPTILINGKVNKNAHDFASIKRYLAKQ